MHDKSSSIVKVLISSAKSANFNPSIFRVLILFSTDKLITFWRIFYTGPHIWRFSWMKFSYSYDSSSTCPFFIKNVWFFKGYFISFINYVFVYFLVLP